jgi:hypothetical protein
MRLKQLNRKVSANHALAVRLSQLRISSGNKQNLKTMRRLTRISSAQAVSGSKFLVANTLNKHEKMAESIMTLP